MARLLLIITALVACFFLRPIFSWTAFVALVQFVGVDEVTRRFLREDPRASALPSRLQLWWPRIVAGLAVMLMALRVGTPEPDVLALAAGFAVLITWLGCHAAANTGGAALVAAGSSAFLLVGFPWVALWSLVTLENVIMARLFLLSTVPLYLALRQDRPHPAWAILGAGAPFLCRTHSPTIEQNLVVFVAAGVLGMLVVLMAARAAWSRPLLGERQSFARTSLALTWLGLWTYGLAYFLT